MLSFLACNWFPLALVGLFLLTIPGLVLTILTLSGQDADLNSWLQEHWHLAYHLDHPDEARDIGERARKRALAEHTLRHRIEEMLAVLR